MKKIFVLSFLLLFCCTTASLAKQKEKPTIVPGSGYVGTLPDVTERFNTSSVQDARPSVESESGFNDQNAIKPIPRQNPAFVNIIMKKDKTSQYINDLNGIIPIVEKMQTSIEDKENIQKFNARSYFLKEKVEYFRDKYKDKAEGSYISFKQLMKLNTQVQAISQLRVESEEYSPYVSAEQSGNIFSQNTINQQLDYLLEEIKKTLIVLKEAK